MSRTSFDGSVAVGPRRSCCRCDSPLAAAADASSPKTRSSVHPSEDTNRKASIVASIKGRARVGLQVRIFRRKRSLKVEEGRVSGVAVEMLRLLLVAGRDAELGVGDEVVEVEFVARRRELECCGVVTSQRIVFKIGRVGCSDKPAFKDKAICVSGLWQAETIAEVAASRNWRWRSRDAAGGNGCCDAASHAEGGASADRHCRSWHNIAAGCCVASAEVFAIGAAGASATGVAAAAGWARSSSASGIGLRAGERDAGLTVVLVADGMDLRSCSSELASPIAGLWPSWVPKSDCENVTGD